METGGIAGSAQQLAPPLGTSVQARLEQLEAAIGEAHTIVAGITPINEAEEKQPDAGGADACLDRCQGQMQKLIVRLTDLRDRVGHL